MIEIELKILLGAALFEKIKEVIDLFIKEYSEVSEPYELEKIMWQSIDPIINPPHDCNYKAVKFTKSNGVIAYQNQCPTCLGTTGEIKKSSVCYDPPERKDPTSARRERYNKENVIRSYFRQRILELNIDANERWWKRYNEYLSSREWKDKRRLVLERDGYQCQARLAGCEDRATEVHHKTYKHVFSEPIFDLESICASCHFTITKMDRDQ